MAASSEGPSERPSGDRVTDSPAPTEHTPTPGQSSVDDGNTTEAADPITRGRNGNPAPSTASVGESGFAAPVVTSGEVTVLKPTPKDGGVWVAVEITNHGAEAASYAVTVRVSGPDGYRAQGTYNADHLKPGESGGSGYLLTDRESRPVPDDPEVSIVNVTRTPS